ncbi:unnamed protein product [Durusdinium trenchii]|uniref:Uncharacterized protein n=1 Tax=Durusdinium trenchii TaxID=1381693 RepID=A0ABP0IYG7_9DINO
MKGRYMATLCNDLYDLIYWSAFLASLCGHTLTIATCGAAWLMRFDCGWLYADQRPDDMRGLESVAPCPRQGVHVAFVSTSPHWCHLQEPEQWLPGSHWAVLSCPVDDRGAFISSLPKSWWRHQRAELQAS